MLRVEGVHKTFPRPGRIQRALVRSASDQPVDVLHDIDLDVQPGEIVGLVGPNGAGKTTLIRIIATVLDASSGSVAVDGYTAADEPQEIRRRIGLVLADDRALYWRLTGSENLEFFGRMNGLRRPDARSRGAELMRDFGLDTRDRMVYAYSSGMRARLSIARALLHKPPLLVLDEPTRSLDPVASKEVGGILRATAETGTAVLLSSHRIDEIESLCDRLVVIVDGRLRYSGTVEELTSSTRFDNALHALLTSKAGDCTDAEPADEDAT